VLSFNAKVSVVQADRREFTLRHPANFKVEGDGTRHRTAGSFAFSVFFWLR
jgi:hypothetical protein